MAYSSWKDANENLWMFGGYFYKTPQNNKAFNDMWKYNPATNKWAWMSGTNIPDDSGSYSGKCMPQMTNAPAARNEGRARWTTSDGKFWLYGGYASDNFFTLNDLWMFDPVTLNWTWVNGDSTANHPPVYGIPGVPSATNQPGSRGGANTWVSNSGELYLFGGADMGLFNDLWKYTIDTNCFPVNISENFSSGQSFIFPNPATSEFQISHIFQPNDEINITDVPGKTIFTKKFTALAVNYKLQTTGWPQGIYFVEVISEKGKAVRKMVKQ